LNHGLCDFPYRAGDEGLETASGAWYLSPSASSLAASLVTWREGAAMSSFLAMLALAALLVTACGVLAVLIRL
jgi:hypothetical protein